MLLSTKLASTIDQIRPATREILSEETKALWGIFLDSYPHMGHAEIRLSENGIQHNGAADNETPRWGYIAHFPLTITWEVATIENKRVVFLPQLCCDYLDERWAFVLDYLAAVVKAVEPMREDTLPEPVQVIAGEEDDFYLLTSEL